MIIIACYAFGRFYNPDNITDILSYIVFIDFNKLYYEQ
jgi:hypothetical protein